MIVTFKTKGYSDITMFGDVAVQLLKIMGHSGTVPGAFRPEEVPAALERLKKAAGADDAPAFADSDSDEEGKRKEPPVPLRNRALPLIELLEAADKREVHVMWE